VNFRQNSLEFVRADILQPDFPACQMNPEPDAVWWFNLPALFVADCVLIIPALHILAARRGLIRRIQYCSLWGALVSTALFLLSWQFHLEVS